MKDTLHLNISGKPFQVMITGEKTKEYRRPSKWIRSRLFNLKTGKRKNYKFVKFTWGYGSDRPYFIAKFKYFIESERNYTLNFTNGLEVKVEVNDFIIHYGEILKTHLTETKTLFKDGTASIIR